MRAIIQRVSKAKVVVDEEITGEIGLGFLILLGIHGEDSEEILHKMVDKIIGIRLFRDDQDKMNLSLKDVGGQALVVSQFTLYANTKKGRRPHFLEAAKPDKAQAMYNQFCEAFQDEGIETQTGRFGEMMEVSLTNDGPVTITLDSEDFK